MTPERAAELLGVTVDASPTEVERAFHRRARLTHPDVSADESPEDAGAAFREAAAARDVLLRPHAPLRRVIDDAYSDGRPVPRVQGAGLIAVWAGLIVLAAFLSIFRSDYPLPIAEPLARWGILLIAAVAYAATGYRVFLVIAIVAEVASLVLTIRYASLGGLLGLLITLPALLGAFTGGLARERVRRLFAAATGDP